MDRKDNKDSCYKTVPVAGRKEYDIEPIVSDILDQARSLTAENFEVLCLELMKNRKLSKEQIVRVKNLLINEEKRAAAEEKRAAKNEARAGGSGQPRMADPGPSPSSLWKIPVPATKVPLIVRMDLVAANDVLALDTEKIINVQHKPLAGDVAVVDLKGRLVYWAYIQRIKASVCRLNTAQTGLTMEKLENGIPEDLMLTTLGMVLKGKTVVGMKLKDDLDHLGFTTGNLPDEMKICELQDFFLDQNHQPIKLSQLAIHFIGSDPQEGAHSSLRDARITAICYRRMLAFKSAGFLKFECVHFNDFRQQLKNAPKPKQVWEPCRCGLTKKKGHKKKQPKQIARLYVFDDADLSDWE